MQWLRRRAEWLTRALEWMVDQLLALVTWFPWTLLTGALPGVIIWQHLKVFQLHNLFENDVMATPTAAVFAGVSSAVYLAACIGVHRLKRFRNMSFGAFCQTVNRFAIGLVIVPAVVFVWSHPVSEQAPFFTLLLCAGAGVLAGTIFYGIPGLAVIFEPADLRRRWLPLLLVLILCAGWAVTIIRMEFVQHNALRTCDWDFGLYINTMWKSLHGDFLGCSLYHKGNHGYLHFDPILILLSPVLLIYPDAQSLIVLQGLWVASGAVPLFLLARRHAQNAWLGVVLAAVYLLHPALHGPSLYDFHSLMLAGPLMLWCMHFLEAGAFRRFFAVFVLLLMTREDIAGIAVFIGLYAYISGKPRKVALGAMALALLYGAVVYFAVISKGHSYINYFEEMPGEHQWVATKLGMTAVNNPIYLLMYLLAEKKLIYILQLMVPLLFLPVFSRKHYILYLCGFAVTLLGSKNCLTNISMQYSTWWLPFMFAAMPTAIENVSQSRLAAVFKLNAARIRTALVGGVLVSALAMSAAYGAFFPNASFGVGYDRLVRELGETERARLSTLEKIKEMIPDDASVMASQHLVPHLAVRQTIWPLDRAGYRVGEPDFAVVWTRDMRSKKEYKVRIRKKNLSMLTDSSRYEKVLEENDITFYRLRHRN